MDVLFKRMDVRFSVLKVVALICGTLALILQGLSVAPTTWLEADRQREGLWEVCYWITKREVICKKKIASPWIEACRSFCLVAMVVCLLSVIITVCALRSESSRWKYTLYKVAVAVMFMAALFEVIPLIIFPVMFMRELEERVQSRLEIGWAYGMGWGSTIFMAGAAFLLLFDNSGAEELIYREKTYYNNQIEVDEEGENTVKEGVPIFV